MRQTPEGKVLPMGPPTVNPSPHLLSSVGMWRRCGRQVASDLQCDKTRKLCLWQRVSWWETGFLGARGLRRTKPYRSDLCVAWAVFKDQQKNAFKRRCVSQRPYKLFEFYSPVGWFALASPGLKPGTSCLSLQGNPPPPLSSVIFVHCQCN